jgi:hypothetical protein
VDRSIADDSDVALVDLPSTSGAHWANRDSEALARRPAQFRRPPAVNSFQGGDFPPAADEAGADTGDHSWDAFAPSSRAARTEAAWEAFGAEQSQLETDSPAQPTAEPLPQRAEPAARHTGEQARVADRSRRRPRQEEYAEPSFGPAAPAAAGRASFGVTEGPISSTRPDLPDSPGEMAWPASAPSSPAPVGPPESHIGDMVSGPGREIRAHRAARTPDVVTQGPAPGRSRLRMVATIALTGIVLLGGAVAGVAFFADEDQSITSMLRLGSSGGDDKVATAALGGRTTATFEVVAATAKVTVRMADLGGDLYRITSAGDSGTVPSPVLSEDKVQMLLSPDGDGTSGAVEVVLSTKVAWALRFVGGADEQIVNLTGGKVSSIDLTGGSRRVDLTLPQPTGTVPLRVTGAIDDLSVTSPAGSPVRVQVDSGAKTVTAGDKTLRDVEPGSTLTPKDWKVPNRYDIDAASRITLLTVKNLEK